jgi:hypothetical protein
LKLPAGPLEEFLKAVQEFKEPLAKAAKADRKSIPKAVLKVLGFDEPTAGSTSATSATVATATITPTTEEQQA